jgi:hypothetical protein
MLCKITLSQTDLQVYKINAADFFKENVECDVRINQHMIQQNLNDGEYFIYYDKACKRLWMNGVITDQRLEGKWEFRNRENQIVDYKMFSAGKEITMDLPKNNFVKIYLPHKKYKFEATYISSNQDTLSKSNVILSTEAQRYEVLHNLRFKGEWTFNYTRKDSIQLGGIYPWNNWVETAYCSITETENLIEIYPPRRNQYAFTEVIKFPSIHPNNLEAGYKWNSQTHIPQNYELEEWSNTTFYHQTEITGKASLFIQNENIECWVIKGNSTNKDFGTSYFEYLFNEEYGFVRMEWINYDRQKAVFELIEVIGDK